MVAPTCFGITLPSSGSDPSAFWEMLNWEAVDRILWMGVLCLVTWYAMLGSACLQSLTLRIFASASTVAQPAQIVIFNMHCLRRIKIEVAREKRHPVRRTTLPYSVLLLNVCIPLIGAGGEGWVERGIDAKTDRLTWTRTSVLQGLYIGYTSQVVFELNMFISWRIPQICEFINSP
jgi:hypothetical protein